MRGLVARKSGQQSGGRLLTSPAKRADGEAILLR